MGVETPTDFTRDATVDSNRQVGSFAPRTAVPPKVLTRRDLFGFVGRSSLSPGEGIKLGSADRD